MFPISLVTSITLTGILLYAGVICFVLIFVLNQRNGLNNYKVSELDFAFLIYIAAFFICTLVNSGFDAGLNSLFGKCQDYFVYFWVVSFFSKNPKQSGLIQKAIFIAAFITILYGLFQFFHLDLLHRQGDLDRLSGFHKNSYTYAGQLIVFFFFLLNGFDKRKDKLIALLLPLLCMFCILNSSERAVIFGVIAGLILYFILHRISLKDILLFFSILLLPVLVTVIFHRKVIKRIKKAVLPGATSVPNIRFKLWGTALAIWKRHFLFGSGRFPTVSYQIGNTFSIKYLTHAHNVYFQILATDGLIGLIAFLNLFYTVIKVVSYNLKTNKYAYALFSVLLAFFIEGIFEYFWGDSEVRYLLLYFIGYVVGNALELNTKKR